MDIWVKNLKTGEKWKLDNDKSKMVYKDGNRTMFQLRDISCFRFFPCDPDKTDEFREERCKEIEKNTEGYQFDIFDFKENANDTMA